MTSKLVPLVALAVLSACNTINPSAEAPKGNPGITPNSGPWTFDVSGHPEMSKVYTLTFGALGNVPLVTMEGGPGEREQATVDWHSGNFTIFVRVPTSTPYPLAEKFSIAIESATRLSGLLIYNSDAVSGGSLLGGGGSPSGSNGLARYQANFTASYGAPAGPSAAPAASASPAPGASP